MKERGFRCPSPGCGQRYASRYNVKRHLACAHPNFVLNQCPVCLRVLSSRQNFRQHQFIHTGDRPYKCNLCPDEFRQSSQLSLHRKRHYQQARTVPIAKLTDMLRMTSGLNSDLTEDLKPESLQLPPLSSGRRTEKQSEHLPNIIAFG